MSTARVGDAASTARQGRCEKAAGARHVGFTGRRSVPGRCWMAWSVSGTRPALRMKEMGQWLHQHLGA
ncbi:hypothetical protein [Streptomyces rishiriensis]|uniref:hypothetical protein n=1 Tax=Streptomyces rishiriensis TaxID=68264 RepID=UPI0037D754B2